MIELQALSLQRGSKPLLDNASLRLHSGDHCALVGANGSGKSTLFQLLLGELTQDQGDLDIPAGWRIAHMAQEVAASERSAVDYVIDGHRELRLLESRLEECSDDLEMARLHAALDELKAWQVPSEAEKLLLGLGFSMADIRKPVRDFSGGWRIRLNLAQALLQPSDLLLLDEPTNHLDLEACLWLERWLQNYPGTLLLISHDRDFIDACCKAVIHLERRQLRRYSGNYSAFERQRAERLAQQQQAFEKQQVEIAHMQDFVRRFRAKATKARQAQSRLKALERMETIAPAHVDSPFSFGFYPPRRLSDPVINLQNADLGYQTPVLNKVNLSLHPDSRIGLLGANGQGKSTLVKSLAGEIKLVAGERTRGEHCDIAYFGQHQLEALDVKASPLTQLQRLRPNAREQEIRDFLGGFNFRRDPVDNDITTFSGGEKARLALALLVWQKPGLLLLDEPTNHLDLDMCHALTVALQDFEGAVVLISHDRHLLRNSCEQFLLVDGGRVREYDGDLEDYRNHLQGDAAPTDATSGTLNSPTVDKKQQRQAAAAKRAAEAPLRKRIKQLEAAMEKQGERLSVIEDKLGDAGLYEDSRKAELQALLLEQGEARSLLEEAEAEWLELSEQLEG